MGVTTEIEGSIKTSSTPFHTPFLHLHKVQDQGYILCIYNYAQKCIVIALQNHFRKLDLVSHYENESHKKVYTVMRTEKHGSLEVISGNIALRLQNMT